MPVTLRLVVNAPARPAPDAGAVWRWLMRAWAISTTRRHLAELDDRALSDLGLHRSQAMYEANRPFWDMTGR